MEIRKVENEVKKDYPKKEQVSKSQLSKSIPIKWKIVGVTTLAITTLVKHGQSFAAAPIAGGFPVENPNPMVVSHIVLAASQLISVIISLITGIIIIIRRNGYKKQEKPKKPIKGVTIIYIISLVILVISTILHFIIDR